jgi:Protein kinase domain
MESWPEGASSSVSSSDDTESCTYSSDSQEDLDFQVSPRQRSTVDDRSLDVSSSPVRSVMSAPGSSASTPNAFLLENILLSKATTPAASRGRELRPGVSLDLGLPSGLGGEKDELAEPDSRQQSTLGGRHLLVSSSPIRSVMSAPDSSKSAPDAAFLANILLNRTAMMAASGERKPGRGVSLDLGLLSGDTGGKGERAGSGEHVVVLRVRGPRIQNHEGVELRLSSSSTLQTAQEQLLPYLRPTDDLLDITQDSFWKGSTRLSFEEPLWQLLRDPGNSQNTHALHFGPSPPPALVGYKSELVGTRLSSVLRGKMLKGSAATVDESRDDAITTDGSRTMIARDDLTRLAQALDQAGRLCCTDIRGEFVDLPPSDERPFVNVIVPSRRSAYFDVSWAVWDYCSSLKPSMVSVGPQQEADELLVPENTARVVVGNPFGIPDNRSVWGESTTGAIGRALRRKFAGECPLYSAFVVEAPGSACRFLLYVCGFYGQFEAGSTLEDIRFYALFQAIFSACSRHNHKAVAGDRIAALRLDLDKNLFPAARQTDVPLQDVMYGLARQLFISLLVWFYPPKEAATARFGAKLGALVAEPCGLTSVDARQQFYRVNLPSGSVAERGVSLAQMPLLLDVLDLAYQAYLGAVANSKHTHRHKPRRFSSSKELHASKRGAASGPPLSPEEAVTGALVDHGFATSARTAERLFVQALTACVQLAWPAERAVGLRTAIRSRGLMPLLVAWVADGWNCTTPKAFILEPEVCAHTRAQTSEIDELGPISRGATAAVVRGTWRGQAVAVKNFEIPVVAPSLVGMAHSEEGYHLRSTWREIVVASMLRHPNLTPCLAAILPGDAAGSTEGTLCASVVMPLMGPDLRTVLDDTPEALSDEDRLSILLQVACGIEYLHSCGVVHRDVKSLNVLLLPQQQPQDGAARAQTHAAARVAQLTDFGSCRPLWTHDKIPQEQQQMTAGIGTTAWMAPELFTGKPYGKAVDGTPKQLRVSLLPPYRSSHSRFPRSVMHYFFG